MFPEDIELDNKELLEIFETSIFVELMSVAVIDDTLRFDKVLFVEIKLDVVIEDDLMLLDVRLVIEVLSDVKLSIFDVLAYKEELVKLVLIIFVKVLFVACKLEILASDTKSVFEVMFVKLPFVPFKLLIVELDDKR